MFGLTPQDLISQDILRLISLFLHFLVHYTYFSEFPNQLCLFTWILEDLGHETEDALALHPGSSVSPVRILVPMEICQILQNTFKDQFWLDP